MIAGIFCYSIIGTVIGCIFSLLFINFDKSWKKISSSFVSLGGSCGIIVYTNNFFGIKTQEMKFLTVSFMYIMFLISFILMMIIMCKLIKDKDDADILRIRDILLGQKSYIDKYYEQREREIDEKLNINKLNNYSEELQNKEKALNEQISCLKKEEERIDKIGRKKLRFLLPENAYISLTTEYIELIPSYFKDITNCIIDIKSNENTILDNGINDFVSFRGYLISIASSISSYIFNGNSSEIRIHFRYYDIKRNGYVKLLAMIGKKIVEYDMTFIPYEKDNMISKSYECKRALIKSINSTHDYEGKNHKLWKDYLTYTFHNLEIEGKPFLSFGISVKNETRYEKIFHFLNYFKFEEYLQETIVNVNDICEIKNILYGGK